MFQTIGHRHGWVQIYDHTIQAWSHGELIGSHYATVQGAKCAITRAHTKWLREVRWPADAAHYAAIKYIVSGESEK